MVAGQKFAIEFTAKETTCSKESNQELTESCEIKSPGVSTNTDVYFLPGNLFDMLRITCFSLLQMTSCFLSSRIAKSRMQG